MNSKAVRELMNHPTEARASVRLEEGSIDWRSTEPIGPIEKLKLFLKDAIRDLLQGEVVGSCNQVPRCSAAASSPKNTVYQECAPLSHANQFASAASVIEDAIINFGRVRGFQRAAARQLNAADYALQQMLAGLEPAMPAMAVKTASRATPLAVANQPTQAGSKPVTADDDGALAA